MQSMRGVVRTDLKAEEVLSRDAVREYLDGGIGYWRDQLVAAQLKRNRRQTFMATCYLDAYTQMRANLLGAEA